MKNIVSGSAVALAGLATSLLTAIGVTVIDHFIGLNLFTFSVFVVLPAGAGLCGFAAASGYYLERRERAKAYCPNASGPQRRPYIQRVIWWAASEAHDGLAIAVQTATNQRSKGRSIPLLKLLILLGLVRSPSAPPLTLCFP